MSEQFDIRWFLATLVVLFSLSFFIDIEALREAVKDEGSLAPIIIVALKMSTIVVAPLSGSPLYPLAGFLFGFWPGVALVAVGDFLGYTSAFYISRIFGRDKVLKFLSQKEDGLLAKFMEVVGTGKGFFQACLTGFAVPEVLAYGAGLSPLPYWKFILILWPSSTLLSFLTVSLGTFFPDAKDTDMVMAGIPVLGLLCIAIGGYLLSRRLKKDSRVN